MKTFKVILDGDEELENVVGWYIAGNALVLNFKDGSVSGFTGFVRFDIEVVGDSNDKPR